MQDIELQQEDTVSADRKVQIVFDPDAWKKKDKSGRKITSVTSRQNFNNSKYGNRSKQDDDEEEQMKEEKSQIKFVTGNDAIKAGANEVDPKPKTKKIAEAVVKKALKQIAIDKNVGIKDIPFDGPYTKTPADVVDKSGAHHTPYSRVRHLARQAMNKQQVKEETLDEKAAEGFEGTVKAMKKHKEIDNPWALSHWMKKQGYKSHVKEEAEFEFEIIQEGTDYNVTITHYVKGEDGNRTSTKHDYVIKNALSRKHAKNIAMNKHSDKVGPLKPGHSFGTDSFATKELTKEEVELNEGKMGQIHADIEDHLGKHLADYKAHGGAEHFGAKTVKTAQHISKLHGIEQKHAQKFVNDYVEGKLKESEMTLDELLEEAEQLEESSVRTRDGDIVKAGDDVGYKDGYEKYGKVHKIQGDTVHIKSWDSDRGEHFIHAKHKSQIWKEEAEYVSESPIEKAPRKFSGMHDKVEAPGMRTQAERAALKAAAKRINDRSKQQANEETEMSDKLTYAQFMEQLLEYTPGPGGVTRVQGRSYGAQYHDPEGDDDADDKPKAEAPKRGRGRPKGSTSGANHKVTSGKKGSGVDYTGFKLHLPNSNR